MNTNTALSLVHVPPDVLDAVYPQPAPDAKTLSVEERREQARLRNTIVTAGAQIALPEWGGYGDIVGTIRTVELARLWVHPAHPISFSEDELEQAAIQLASVGQSAPLQVQAAADPTVSHDPNRAPVHDLMLVDATGIKFALAAPRRAVDRLLVVVSRYVNLYESTKVLALPLFSQHTLSEIEEDRILASLRLSYNLSRRANPDMPPFPTQQEWARLLHLDQSVISRKMAVGDLPDGVILELFANHLTVAQAKEMLPLPAPLIQTLASELVEENLQHPERPVTQKATRERVRKLRQEQKQQEPEKAAPTWRERDIDVPANLWVGDAVDGLPIAAVVSRLGQDLRRCLEAIRQAAPRHDAGVEDLLRVLHNPAVQRLIGTPQTGELAEVEESGD